ncbi:dethiobiotin synthase [Chryseolinea sp. H1M3-3]|uniref:dethiobiotin synthase n=1 Tax=Chryseolinea sp. H1M3-3 TaxID=3034144 RepID=UPI0023EAC1FB|nr:dethiobiotin synthase [Chryseolinea sp. H1M3-3]
MIYFVTAIGTDSGKTVASAILCEALQADYWKPVQAGFPTDSETVKELLNDDGQTIIHPERYILKTPASPHAAAALENIKIQLEDFEVPDHDNDLIIEGAGGCLVPLNDRDLVIDLATKFKATVILVSNFYLGSINHTLLTYEALRSRNIPVKGIIFNGVYNSESERIILHHTGLIPLLHIDKEQSMNGKVIQEYARKLKSNWNG